MSAFVLNKLKLLIGKIMIRFAQERGAFDCLFTQTALAVFLTILPKLLLGVPPIISSLPFPFFKADMVFSTLIEIG